MNASDRCGVLLLLVSSKQVTRPALNPLSRRPQPPQDGHGGRQQASHLRKASKSTLIFFQRHQRQQPCPTPSTPRINKPSSSTKGNATRCPSSMGA